jgi:hypothetical protein
MKLAQHGDRQRDAGDDGRPPRVQEQEHAQHREHRAEEQGLFDVEHGRATRWPSSSRCRYSFPFGSVVVSSFIR